LASNFQKVLAGKRVSLPESYSKRHGINEGDIVILEEDNSGSLRITPAQVVPKK
jgi:bifunctional DNA-binding transcriptional regulator/antitoxin component of YhaV-PrlF toxin-antitoxin module